MVMDQVPSQCSCFLSWTEIDQGMKMTPPPSFSLVYSDCKSYMQMSEVCFDS